MKIYVGLTFALLQMLIDNSMAKSIYENFAAQKNFIMKGDESSFSTLFDSPGLSINKDPLNWQYDNQEAWSDLYEECGGQRQSPILLNRNSAVEIESEMELTWSNYHSLHEFLTLQNTGLSIEASSTFKNGDLPELQGGPLTGVYKFAAMHWHWGSGFVTGAEHVVNSENAQIELHAIHYNAKFASFEEAVASGESEALTVVGILFQLSVSPNPGLAIITNAMSAAEGPGEQDIPLPLGDFGFNFNSKYFSYLGSLTNPPCLQIVRWIVLEEPSTISLPQLLFFQHVLVNDEPLVDTYRAPQELNGRNVYFYT